jgi:hypothetical protein
LTKRCKILDVGYEEPTWHIRDFPDRSLGYSSLIFFRDFERLPENVVGVPYRDLVKVNKPHWIVNAAFIQKCAVDAAKID